MGLRLRGIKKRYPIEGEEKISTFFWFISPSLGTKLEFKYVKIPSLGRACRKYNYHDSLYAHLIGRINWPFAECRIKLESYCEKQMHHTFSLFP